MALEANVPLAVTALDWRRKQVGIVGYVTPTGDLNADFAQIRQLLEGVQGKYPDKQTPAYPRPAES